MTRTALLTTTGLVLGLAVFTTGCKKNKEVAKPKGEVEIVEFCTGSEYNSDSKHFRSPPPVRAKTAKSPRRRPVLPPKAGSPGPSAPPSRP